MWGRAEEGRGQSTCGGELGGEGSEHMWGRAEEGRG